jgi:hypothetical protein
MRRFGCRFPPEVRFISDLNRYWRRFFGERYATDRVSGSHRTAADKKANRPYACLALPRYWKPGGIEQYGGSFLAQSTGSGSLIMSTARQIRH